ncbi:MAG: PfkB family carbohydrate kinase, partial [Pseudomonadota bacterium]
RKLRVMAGYQQVVRIDSESTDSLSSDDEKLLVAKIRDFMGRKGSKALVISDYGKGVCTTTLLKAAISMANDHNVPVVTDPKSLDMKRYSGTTLIKPNLSEGRDILKVTAPGARYETFDDEINAVCNAVLSLSGARNVVLSLSEKGVTIRGKDVDASSHFESMALQVADVSGAGDQRRAHCDKGFDINCPKEAPCPVQVGVFEVLESDFSILKIRNRITHDPIIMTNSLPRHHQRNCADGQPALQ